MLKIKNYQLVDVLELLEKLALTPRASRVRTKLCKFFYNKMEELHNDEMALLEKYGKKDDAGKLIQNDGNYTLIETSATEYHQEKATLLEEDTIINLAELKEKIPVLITELENSDIKVSGKDAAALDVLLDALENEMEV